MENSNISQPKKSQLQVLLKKNFLLWKRNTCCSIAEILLPLIICSFLFIIRGTTDVIELPETTYIKKLPIQGFPDVPNYFYPNYPQSSIEKQSMLPQHLQNEFKEGDFPVNIKDCLTGQRSDKRPGSYRNGYIALTPKNSITQELAQTIESIYNGNDNYKVQFYNNMQDLNQYIESDNYGEDICFAVNFEQTGELNNQWKYGLHFNTTGNPEQAEVPLFNAEESQSYKISNIKDYYQPWVKYGFVQVQNWIDNIILQSKGVQGSIGVQTTSVKTEPQIIDPLTSALKGQLSTYIVQPMIILFLRMTYQILLEKEKKIKEGMKIMGLKSSAFYLSWIIQYLCSYTVVSIIMSLILKATVFKNSDWTLIFIWLWLFCISLIFQSLFMQTFFTKAKVGTLVATIVYIVFLFILFAINDDSNTSIKRSVSIFSQSAISLSSDTFFLIEAKNQGITWSNLGLIVEKYSVGISLYMMIINIILFGGFALYLDLIFPNEFGKKLHPLFCIPYFRKKKSQQPFKEELLNKKEAYVEEVDATLKEKEQNNEILHLQNIVKQYPNGKVAVNNLSLKMYKDQISCLLGHNGSGKSTTFSMLNGMQEFTQGEGQAFGLDITTEMEELRTIMGVCPQHDILFDQLTCKEHLELYAALKGVPKNSIDEQVAQLLEDVDLTFKENEQSKTLSGGQKRRLSVAIAFIGGSKLVYLDEPTSGCDTSARRHIWEMLRKYKQNRIVLLTTHFMDEAEFLGDRIAIIGNGKLICHGSPLYLKNKFGIGYNLTIIKKKATDDNSIIKDCVEEKIPNAKLLSEVSSEIQYQLRMEDIHLFEDLFNTLENNKNQFNISNYGVSITSMEEVFLKVADMGEDIDFEELNQEDQIRRKSIVKQDNKILNSKVDDFDIDSVREQNESKVFFMHLGALIKKRLIYFKRDYKGLICEIIIPCILVLVGLILMSQDFIQKEKGYTLTGDIYNNKQLPILYSGYQDSERVRQIMNMLDNNNFKIEEAQINKFDQTFYSTLIQFDDLNYQKQEVDRKGAVFFSEINNQNFQYLLEIDTTNKSALPYYVNQINNAILRFVMNDKSANIEVTVNTLAFPQKIKNLENVGDGFVAALIFSMALAFIPSSVIIFSVKEREDQVKHQQIVSGISIFSYWISNLIVDYLKYAFSAMLFCIVMISVFNINAFTQESDAYAAIVLLFVFYGLSVICFTYVFGFIFKQYGNAQTATFFLHFLVGSILPIVVFIFRIIPSTKTLGNILQWVFRFIPSFAFSDGVLSLGAIDLLGNSDSENDDNKSKPNAFSIDIAGADIIYLVITSILYFLALFLVERVIYKGTLEKLMNKSDLVKYKPKLLDDDVKAEVDKIKKTSPKDYTVRVEDLRKIYKISSGYLEAVDKVSFGIENGECFTLLGVNGAGKSTTFKMLSGDIQPTEGQIHIQNYNVQTEMDRARQYIGYCPQFDALIDNLTAQEHLELYCAIKRIPSDLRPQLIQQKLEELDLLKFKNVISSTYSGGNKRKLSVAIAMIGNPPIVFLDEPSTGMDPKARRYMWSVISKISTERKRSSIILTTHMMEEAEALSTRIAIMVKGQLKCLGSIQHIKNKFGKGYEVELVIKLPSQEDKQLLAQQSNKDLNQRIKEHELAQTLDDLKQLHRFDDITQDGIGSSLYQAMKSKQGLTIDMLIEYIIIQERGQNIKNFINEKMGNFNIIEQFAAFYRFKIESIVTIGQIFGLFQTNKDTLFINSYSVKQATIEQIFNMFAKDEIDTKLYNQTNFQIQEDIEDINNSSMRQMNSEGKKNTSYFKDIEVQMTDI